MFKKLTEFPFPVCCAAECRWLVATLLVWKASESECVKRVKGWKTVLVLENVREVEHLARAEIRLFAVFQRAHLFMKK